MIRCLGQSGTDAKVLSVREERPEVVPSGRMKVPWSR